MRKTFVVAVEGSETEPQYLDAFKARFRSVNITVIRKSRTGLSPREMLKRLNKRKREVRQTRGGNVDIEYWLVFDHDNLQPDQLANIVSEATNKGYKIADSKPCFELWLILHCKRMDQLKGLEGSAVTKGCQAVIEKLQELDKNYEKTRYDASTYAEKVENAITNAKSIDKHVNDNLLNHIGSRVYKLVQSIIDSSPNNP